MRYRDMKYRDKEIWGDENCPVYYINLTQEQKSLIHDLYKDNNEFIAHNDKFIIESYNSNSERGEYYYLHWAYINSEVVRDILKSIGLEEKYNVDYEEWDQLIEDHYKSAVKRNPKYGEKYTKWGMKRWWYRQLYGELEEYGHDSGIRDFIKGSTYCNNNGLNWHPL